MKKPEQLRTAFNIYSIVDKIGEVGLSIVLEMKVASSSLSRALMQASRPERK